MIDSVDPSSARDQLFLAAIPVGGRHLVAARIAVLVSSIVFLVAAAFVRTALDPLPAFVPAYEASLALIELITFVMLLGQFLRAGSPAVYWLALGYLFDGLIIIPHLLTFPGAFSSTGWLGAGTQTTAWLFTFWHAGLPLFVLAFFLAPLYPKAPPRPAQLRRQLWFGITGTVLLVLLLTLVATAGMDWLPVVMVGSNYQAMSTKGISPGLLLICALALFTSYIRRRRSILDLWVTVVVGIWMLDIAMSSVIGSSRYDLGWYMGRTFNLVSGTVLLIVLLIESNALYGYLAQTLALADERNRELVRSKEQLARAQRLDAMGQLTGGVAHDFNNVLQIISANLYVIQMRRPDDERVQDSIRRALEGVKRGARLSSELLSFASKQPLRPTVMNISQLLRGMDDILRHTLGAEIDIETVIAGGLWNTMVDAALLENAILNLALNGRDAMMGAGKLTIEAGNASLSDDYVAAIGDQIAAGQYVVVTVTDTGQGMSAELMERVFEPFFTTKPVGRGTGLGLSMVYGFVKQSKGHVKIYSEVGQGTSIKIYLPRSYDAKTAEPASETAILEPGSEQILIVEDDESVRNAAIEMLGSLGYRTHAAGSASEADQMLEAGLIVDLLFTDVVMPGPLKTTEMVQRATERLPNLAVLYTSGYTENAIVHGGKLDPGVRLLSKPYRPEQLSAMIRRLLDNPAATRVSDGAP